MMINDLRYTQIRMRISIYKKFERGKTDGIGNKYKLLSHLSHNEKLRRVNIRNQRSSYNFLEEESSAYQNFCVRNRNVLLVKTITLIIECRNETQAC